MSTLATIDDPIRLAARAGTAIGRATAPTDQAPPIAEPEDDEPAPVKLDRMVSENRARTPQAAADARRTPRLSIREINELDSEEIRRRLDKIKRDDRSPTEQVLDLIDLPRNAVMQVVAPGLARKAKEAGNTGTFGLGKVSASDVLGEMGVENRIVRGVVGFAGDVLLDPLTYVGPAGWGAQITGKAASVSLRSAGRKALRNGIAEAAAGRTVRDPHLAKYLAAKGLSRLEGEAVDIAHSRISKAVYGDLAEGALDKAFVPFGADRIRKGGDFVNDMFDARGGAASGAARDFYAKYGRGTRGIGPVGGSEIAHLPFTDISLRVKPFTREARMATETHQLAKLRESGLTEAMLTDLRAAGVAPDVMRLVGLQNDMREAEVAREARLAEFDARRKAARPDGPDDDGLPPAAGSPDDVPPAPPDGGLDAEIPRRWVRGIHPGNKDATDTFYSASDEVAKNYSGGKPVEALSAAPKNPLRVESKEQLAEDIGYAGDPRAEPLDASPKFDQLAKEHAQRLGHDAIEYDVGTFDEPELHVFAPQSELDRFIGESREAFKDLPPDDLDAGTALFRATVKGIANRLGKTEEEVAAMLRAQKGDAAGGALNQPAWHGSPHVFDKFSTSKINSGEGAQAYGHGLYFSSQRSVAEWYKNKLSPKLAVMLDGKPAQSIYSHSDLIAGLSQQESDSLASALLGFQGALSRGEVSSHKEFIDYLRTQATDARARDYAAMGDEYDRMADVFDRFQGRVGIEKGGGRLYKVNLSPTDEQLLHWDKPLDQQPRIVQDAVSKLLPDLENTSKYGREINDGQSLYRALEYDAFHNKGIPTESVEASRMLRDLGVRGIKYKGDLLATNFVIFDDADVTIEEVLRQMNRGAFWQDGSKRVIAALDSPDLSTMVHELGHAIRSFLPDDELAIITRVYKMDADLWGAKLNKTAKGLNRREAEERFAKDFERYCATGQLPEGIDEESRTLLTKAFESIKEFLLDLYKNIVGTPLEDRLDPEIKGVFDRMLGGVGVEAKKAGKGPGSFTRLDMENQILSAADRLPQANTGVELSEAVADSSGMDLLDTTFYKKLPQEVTDFLQGRPHLRMLFSVSNDRKAAKGSTVASEMGWGNYLDQLERMGTSRLTRAKQTVRNAGPEAEQARLAAWMHDVTPRGPVKLDKYINPVALADGTEFTIFGHPFVVNTGTDGVRVAVGDTDAFRLDAIETLPFDPGSMQGNGFDPAWSAGGGSPIEDDLPVSPLWQRVSKARGGDVAGQEGMFGQGTYGAGGEQGSLFGQGGSPAPAPAGAADDVPVPVRMVNESDAEYKARLALHAKWKESARNTGMLFQGPANPDDASETLAAIDLEQSAFEQAHAAQQQARVDASREVLARAQAAAAAGTGITLPAGIPHELALHAAYYDAVANVRRQESLLEQTELARTLSTLNRDEGDSLRQLKLVGDKDIAEDLWSIATSNPEAADNLVGIAQRSVETAALQAEVLHGALSNLLTGPESVLLERTKQLIGTDDAWVAASLFAPLARLAAGRLEEDHWATQALERFDRSIRNSLGVRGGMASRFIARQKAEIRHAGMRLNQVDYAVRDRVTKALRAAGKDNAENRAAMLQIAWAKAHPPEQYNLWKFDARGPQYAADGTILNPSRLTETLNAAKAGGLLTDPGLAKEIDAIVKEFGEAMRTMGDAELAEGILGVQMPGYVPNVATQETRDAAARSKQAFGRETREGESAGEKTFRTAQPFQRQRLTSQTRFKDPNGTLGWRRFFEGDRVWLSGLDDLPREQRISRATETMAEDMQRRYAENPQLAASRTAEKAEAIAAAVDYDELVKANPQFAKDFPLRPTDGMELNELFANNRFDYLVGREKGIENFLETDLAAVWANRTMQHHLARATQQVKDMLRNSFTIDPVWAKNNLNLAGQKGVTSTGVPVEVIKAEGRAGNAVFAAKINGRKYRMLDSDLRTDASEHPLLKSLFADAGNKMDGRLFEEKFADTFEDFVMALRPERQAELLGVVDTIQGFWKMYTLTHASWPIFNVVGNTMLALMGRANPAHMVTHAKDAIRLRTMLGDSDGLKNLTLTIRGQKVTGEDLLKQAVSTGVVNNTISLELAAQYARQEPGLLNAADRYFRRVLAPWFRVNQAADDSVRLMAWMAHMEDGSDPVTAAGKVLDSMFDFSDFTKVEERGFRRIFPFYSWIRSNLGFQLKELVQDPKWAAMAPKLQDAIEEAAAGEDRVPENMRPRWMRDSLAAQLNADPSARIGLMLGQNILPSSDLLNVLAPIFGLDGAQKFMHFLVSSMNQIPVSAFEAASGREIFSGREIGGDTGWSGFALSKARPLGEFGAVGSAAGLGGALAGGALGSLAGPTGAIAGNIAGGLLGSQAGAVATGAIAGNESDTTRLLGGKVGITAGRGSIGQAIARANLGGRVQPMDDERLASSVRREFKDAERKLRLRIGALQRTNQPTTDAMADLMALYRDAIRDGMNDVVPKWAAASLSAGPAPASLAVTG